MPRSLTPEQQRNRAIAFVALRVLAGLIAVATAYQLWQGWDNGYFRFVLNSRRGAQDDYYIVDSPFGRVLAAFALETIAVTLGALAVRPRAALKPGFLVPSLAAMMIGTILVQVLYR